MSVLNPNGQPWDPGHYVLVEAYSGFQIHGTIVNVKSGLASYINLCAVYIVGLDLSAFRGEHWHEKLLAAETWLGSLLLPCGPFAAWQVFAPPGVNKLHVSVTFTTEEGGVNYNSDSIA
ncbi:uncharacterized protein EHS24_006005 [Apiotrichum porosum]|uniref:Uncharacterized protein n=1 Tax=Apiotrichum porosum TaxID=105984 RepID=A0A427Y038_9TREE|nr:uncharacterized protein EHS24_006005 [Apiotrichum porosum]RSH84484.1 hypothetical protein EHS24_006005 [Apiotrichum porosum]